MTNTNHLLSYIIVISSLSTLPVDLRGHAQTPTVESKSSTASAILIQQGIEASHEPDLSVGKLGTFSSDQATRILDKFAQKMQQSIDETRIAQAKKEQGEVLAPTESTNAPTVRVRFMQVFPSLQDAAFFPLTDAVMGYAPASSFIGLTVVTQKGKPLGQALEKAKIWHSGIMPLNGRLFRKPTSYTNVLLGSDGHVLADAGQVQYVRWSELKDKIAFDDTERKAKEDEDLERAAISRGL